jgi:hypothetical protein
MAAHRMLRVLALTIVLGCAMMACGTHGSNDASPPPPRPRATLTSPLTPSSVVSSPPTAGVACASLTTVAQPQSTYISAARIEATPTVPAHCRVKLTVAPAIKIIVSLPDAWNGKFQAVGGGGFVGSLPDVGPAIAAGYAAASTDTGHVGTEIDGHFVRNTDGSFNTGLAEDFAYRSNHEMTVKAKALVQAYYGRGPTYSYWNGCSTGGRQGLMEAQRFPNDYDGVLAAAPAINWDRFIPSDIWPQLVLHQSGNMLPSCKLDAVTAAAVNACDDVDGITDDVIEDPRRCTYDPHDLIGTRLDCGVFTTADADAVAKIWDGPRNRQGSFMWHGLERGAPLDALANQAGPFPITNDWIRFWVLENPDWDYRTATNADFETIFQRSHEKFNDLIGTDSPDLSAFRDRGGKLILWHGWNDQVIFPRGTIDYYDRVVATMGARQTNQFARLFMAPGVEHCIGGPGPDTIDAFDHLVTWVETNQAPTRIVASKLVGTSTTQTRPLCSYPQAARYTGRGSTDAAENFRCSKTTK